MQRPRTPETEALIRQLRLEIADHGSNMKQMAKTIGVPYDYFRDCMVGEAQIQVDMVTAVLRALGMDWPTLVKRAGDRLPPQPGE